MSKPREFWIEEASIAPGIHLATPAKFEHSNVIHCREVTDSPGKYEAGILWAINTLRNVPLEQGRMASKVAHAHWLRAEAVKQGLLKE